MKRISKIAAVLTVGVMLVSLTGCSDAITAKAEKAPNALALVIGNHKCSRKPNLNSLRILETVSDTVENYGFISVISIDGNPSLEAGDSYDIPEQYKNADETKLHEDAVNKARNLMERLEDIQANDEEVDTLKAIRIAAESFDEAPVNMEKKMFIVDTGLSTTGLLDFNNNLLCGEPEAVAEMLADKDAIPDLSGIAVTWCRTKVAAPQAELSPGQENVLEGIWKAIIEKGGGTVSFLESNTSEFMDESLPEVSTIELSIEEPVKFDEIDMNTEKEVFDKPVFFSEEQIRFQGDSEKYAEPEKAAACIKPVAEYMLANTDFRILLAGTTADDEYNQYVKELSCARAEKVKSSLIEMGVPKERIVAVGLGNRDPWHIYGVGISGDLAAQNRKVVLLNADVEEAMKIQQEYDIRR